MKKIVLFILVIAVLVVAVAAVIVIYLKKQNDISVSGTFDSRITAKVENGDHLDGISLQLMLYPFDGVYSGDDDIKKIRVGSCSNGVLTITLPPTLSDRYLYPISRQIDGSENLAISDPGVNVLVVDLIQACFGDDQVGNFDQYDNETQIDALFWYADRNVEITGWYTSSYYNMSLKKGWNTVYHNMQTKAYTTQPPDGGVKWIYSEFEEGDFYEGGEYFDDWEYPEEEDCEYDEAALKALIDKNTTSGVKVITVNTAAEFVNAIGSDRVIILKGSPIHIGRITSDLKIVDVNNLKIVGLGNTPVKLLIREEYDNVLVFVNCSNITIENIDAGHWPEKGFCSGGVFYIEKSKNFTINNSIMFGSGMEGITANDVTNIKCNNSIIRGCSYSIMSLTKCVDFEFNDCEFTDNVELDLVNISDCINVIFNRCIFANNRTKTEYDFLVFFNVDKSTSIKLNNCTIENNTADYFCNKANTLELINAKLENNTFNKGNFKE